MTNTDDPFIYHYSIDFADENLVSTSENGSVQTLSIPISYYSDKPEGQKIAGLDCRESLSGFYRKLVFNILSKLPTAGTKFQFKAKYCYVIFENRGFLICTDSIVSTNTIFGTNTIERVVIPAQYLYYLKAADGPSTIEEYLNNLCRVEMASLASGSTRLFQSGNWPYSSGFVVDEFSIEKLAAGIRFSGSGKLCRYPLGEFAGFVPIPTFEDPMNIPKHGLVVGSLGNGKSSEKKDRRHTRTVKFALEELTRILWADGGMTTWIMGQPGSGKEVFAQALHRGAGRALEYEQVKFEGSDEASRQHEKADFLSSVTHMELRDGFNAQSVASVTLDEFNNRLFGVSKEGKGRCIVDVIDKLHGTIFLDEFDKPEKPFLLYSSLLRVLEAGQFIRRTYDETSGRVVETPGISKNVNWIFAGAFTQVDPRKKVPFDLWSRLKGFIHLRNPLEDSVDSDYGSTLFLYWYFRSTAKILDEKTLRPLLSAVSSDPEKRDYRQQVACMLLGHTKTKLIGPRTFVPTSDLQDFASHFQRLLNRNPTFSGDRLDSPRGIFKATEAAFYFLRERVFDGEISPLTNEEILAGALTEAHKALRLSRGPA